jgi:hypothetical protein
LVAGKVDFNIPVDVNSNTDWAKCHEGVNRNSPGKLRNKDNENSQSVI